MFDFVRLPISIELNPWIEFDCVRLSSISERSIEYAGGVYILFKLNHNYNKILESDWLSPAMIRALKGQYHEDFAHVLPH